MSNIYLQVISILHCTVVRFGQFQSGYQRISTMLQFLTSFIITLNKFIKDSCSFLLLCEIFNFENQIFSMKFSFFDIKIICISDQCMKSHKWCQSIRKFRKKCQIMIDLKKQGSYIFNITKLQQSFTYFTPHRTRISHFAPLCSANRKLVS